YIDGMVVASHHILAAVGIDCEGYKHVLGMCEGASENATVATALLESMVQRGIKPDRRRLFVIDGSKALRCAIDCVYGENPVLRWAACAFLAVEAGFNRTMGYEQLWMLKASLDEAREVEERQKTG